MQKRSSAGRICGVVEKMPSLCMHPVSDQSAPIYRMWHCTVCVGNRTHYPFQRYVFQREKRTPLMNRKKMTREFGLLGTLQVLRLDSICVFIISCLEAVFWVLLRQSSLQQAPTGVNSQLHRNCIASLRIQLSFQTQKILLLSWVLNTLAKTCFSNKKMCNTIGSK